MQKIASASSVVPAMWLVIRLRLGAIVFEQWVALGKVAARIARGPPNGNLPAMEQPW